MITVGGPIDPYLLKEGLVNVGNLPNPVSITQEGGSSSTITDSIWTRIVSGQIYPTTITDKVSLGTTSFVGSERLRVSGETNTTSLRTADAYIDTVRVRSGSFYANLSTSLTATRNITIPNAAGTLALTSDIHTFANQALLDTYSYTNASIGTTIGNSHTHTDLTALNTILSSDITNWNTAFSWGDHSLVGYLIAEVDPVFNSSVASAIVLDDYNHWNTAYGWGNHADAGYLLSETDPIFQISAAYTITSTNITNWNTAYTNTHTHTNKTLLDSILNSGDGTYFLSNDGTYKQFVIPSGTGSLVYTTGGSSLGSDADLTYDPTLNILTSVNLTISNTLNIGTGSTIIETAGNLVFTDSLSNTSTLAALIAGATNHWTTTTGGIYYSNYISNHTNPTAELDITGHIVADDFDSNYIRYKDNNLLIGVGVDTTNSSRIIIDTAYSTFPLIDGDTLGKVLNINGEITTTYGIVNFENGNQKIFSDLGILYIQDTVINSGSPLSFSAFIDGTINAKKSDFSAYSTVTGIDAGDVSSWNSKESGLGNPSVSGYILSSTTGGVRSWVPNSGSGVTPTDNVFKWDGTPNFYYRPYSSKTEAGGVASDGKFYLGTSNPDATIRLNYDGDLHVTNLFAVTNLTVGGISSSLRFNTGIENLLLGEATTINSDTDFTGNTIVGNMAGTNISLGSNNTILGDQAGFSGDNTQCLFIGKNAGYNTINTLDNVMIGYKAGEANVGGDDNLLLGNYSGKSLHDGASNVFLGNITGYNGTTVDNSIFIGFAAGYYETGNRKLIIDSILRANESDQRSKALLYGVMDTTTSTQILTINGKLGLNNLTPSATLTIGTAGTSSGSLSLAGATSGTAIIVVPSIAGTPTLTLPTATGTLALTSDITAALPTDDILDWNTNKYTPYASKQSGINFYTGTTDPDGTNRLNLNGYLYSTGVNVQGTGITVNTTTGTCLSVTSTSTGTGLNLSTIRGIGADIKQSGSLGSNNNGNDVLLVERLLSGTGDATGNLINILDNPTTSGTISGKAFSYSAGTTERISFNPRVANGASAVACILDTHNNLTTTGALLSSWRNQGSEKVSFDKDGYGVFLSGVYSGSKSGDYGLLTSGFLSIKRSGNIVSAINPVVVDGANAIANLFNTTTTLSTAGSKLLSVQNNSSSIYSLFASGSEETLRGQYHYHRQTMGSDTDGDWRTYADANGFYFQFRVSGTYTTLFEIPIS